MVSAKEGHSCVLQARTAKGRPGVICAARTVSSGNRAEISARHAICKLMGCTYNVKRYRSGSAGARWYPQSSTDARRCPPILMPTPAQPRGASGAAVGACRRPSSLHST